MLRETLIDRPGALRSEDAFDIEAVDAFLKERVAGLAGCRRPFVGGRPHLTTRRPFCHGA